MVKISHDSTFKIWQLKKEKISIEIFPFHCYFFTFDEILHTTNKSSKWRVSIYNDADIAHHMMALVPRSTVVVVGSNIDKSNNYVFLKK